MVKQYFLSQIWNLNHFYLYERLIQEYATSLSFPLSLLSFITKSSILVFRGCFPCLRETVNWFVTTHLPILLYLIELCSRCTQHWTGSTIKPLPGPLHMHHCQIVTLSLHVANNIKKTWEMFIVWSFHTCIIVSHTVSCIEVLPWLLCKETLTISSFILSVNIPQITSFSSILLKLISQ